MQAILVLALLQPLLMLVSAQEMPELEGAEKVHRYQYKTISGSPYLLDTFAPGTIFGTNLTIYRDIPVNYNGKTQRVEVRLSDGTYELDPGIYLRVEIDRSYTNDKDLPGKMILQRGVHKRFENGFVRVVYRGRRMILVDQFRAEKDDTATDQMGHKDKFTKFRRDHDYYLKHHTEIHPVRLDEKSIARHLGHEEDMEAFILDKGLDVSREKDMARLLKWYEDKGYVR